MSLKQLKNIGLAGRTSPNLFPNGKRFELEGLARLIAKENALTNGRSWVLLQNPYSGVKFHGVRSKQSHLLPVATKLPRYEDHYTKHQKPESQCGVRMQSGCL